MTTPHSNRSPSPLSSRPSSTTSTNPSSRNSDNNSAIRRSFTGNNNNNNPLAKSSVLSSSRRFDQIAPSSSPSSDFTKRRSVGDEKENDEKDLNLKACKLQSPAKGCKNFMSPTISAASKFTPSPRKKVLVERNDPVRTSISLSDGKAMFFSSNVSEDLNSKSEMDSNPNPNPETVDFDKKDAVVLEGPPPIPKPLKKVTFSEVPSDSLSESVVIDSVTDSGSLELESSLRKDKTFMTTPIAPLDADPSLPPYDPKSNYLSPRPRFLHYKPKPRIEVLLNKGLDPYECNLLEDDLMGEITSDNLSESECTEESQSQTEDSQNEQSDVTSRHDIVLGAEEMGDESLPVSTPTVTNESSEANLVVHKREKKKWGLSRLMCFSMVIMFLIACASISVKHSPAFDGLVLEDFSLSDVSSFYHQSRFAASAKANLDRLSRHVNQLSVDFMSFVSKMINELGEGEKMVPLRFVNLTDLQDSTWNEGQFIRSEISEEFIENLEEDEMEKEVVDAEVNSFEDDVYEEVDSEEIDPQDEVMETEDAGMNSFEEVDSEESFEKEIESQDEVTKMEEVAPPLESVKLPELETENSEINQGEVDYDTSTTEQLSEITTDVHQLADISEVQESKFEVQVEVSSDITEFEKLHVDDTTLVSSASLEEERPLDVISSNEDLTIELVGQSENKFFSHYVVGISSLLAALSAFAAAFVYLYKRSPSSANVQTDTSLNNKRVYEKPPLSQNWQTDDIGESSCPSEMSSFQRSASYSKKDRTHEAQSFDRKARKYSKRESLASSSSEFSLSPSYGSFTTYERIPIKHANGEEEIITPVRRSSRIRNHLPVTSS